MQSYLDLQWLQIQLLILSLALLGLSYRYSLEETQPITAEEIRCVFDDI